MKKKFKWMSAMLAMVAIAFAVTFTSCGDDEPEQTNVYTAGFEEMSGGLDMFAEAQTIENAFKAELGSSPIVLTGSAEKCDEEILSKCRKAEAKLITTTFNSSIQYVVRNSTTGKVVYDHTF
ncbi:MAG: hypothetical protein K2H96_08625 [Muribaculaceae bacterium]|nr:hypothetical protein [Muribaculaceae bacterium]